MYMEKLQLEVFYSCLPTAAVLLTNAQAADEEEQYWLLTAGSRVWTAKEEWRLDVAVFTSVTLRL